MEFFKSLMEFFKSLMALFFPLKASRHSKTATSGERAIVETTKLFPHRKMHFIHLAKYFHIGIIICSEFFKFINICITTIEYQCIAMTHFLYQILRNYYRNSLVHASCIQMESTRRTV